MKVKMLLMDFPRSSFVISFFSARSFLHGIGTGGKPTAYRLILIFGYYQFGQRVRSRFCNSASPCNRSATTPPRKR